MKSELPFYTLMLLCAATISLSSPEGYAQVSTNLDALPSSPQPQKHTGHTGSSSPSHATPHSSSNNISPATPAPDHTNDNQPTPPGYSSIPRVPAAPPAPVVIAPPFTPIPTHAPPPPEEVKAVANAGSATTNASEQNLRVTFASNSAEMNEQTIEAIRQFGTQEASHIEDRLILHSYATLPGDDLSMPRRVALERALAVRSLLIRSGIATTRIYPIAQGRPSETDHEPADRLDITVEANPETAPTPTPVASPDTVPSDMKGATTP